MFRGCEIKLKNETILGLIILYLLSHKYLGLFMETNSNSWVLFMGWVELFVLWMGYTLWKILSLYRLWLQMLLLENCVIFFFVCSFLLPLSWMKLILFKLDSAVHEIPCRLTIGGKRLLSDLHVSIVGRAALLGLPSGIYLVI